MEFPIPGLKFDIRQLSVALLLVGLAACRSDDPGPADLAEVIDSAEADIAAPADLPEPELPDIRPELEVEVELWDLASDFPQFFDAGEPDLPPEPDIPKPSSCDFEYDFEPWEPPPAPDFPPELPANLLEDPGPDRIAHIEPEPESTYVVFPKGARDPLVMPGYNDNMPLFNRAKDWNGETRCFETPLGVQFLTEGEAWELYREIAWKTTGIELDTAPGIRTVVGIRGAYPGTFAWHGNTPNRFNDTIVLLWRDEAGAARVKEFPVNTDNGAYNFGWHSSSSLRPNRRYRYKNGWHKTYNAFAIDEWGYQVRDDTNNNGHWDSDRNGWLPPMGAEDHDRTGSGHNIHAASAGAPLGSAMVHNGSAGCQTIPGIANWTEFIVNAWTGAGDPVDYFLVDARDIDPTVWNPCEPDGSRKCPYRIHAFPFSAGSDTSYAAGDEFDLYNCSTANESGPEEVYLFTIDFSTNIHVQVDDVSGQGPDIDIHLLDGDDENACMIRDNISFYHWIPPGRYWIVADTYVEQGIPLAGPYSLDVWLE